MKLKKKVIFTVTTGRSGTKLLASILQFNKKIASYHEPDGGAPFHEYAILARKDFNQSRRFWVEKKIPWINSHNEHFYFESSHLFCKGFFFH